MNDRIKELAFKLFDEDDQSEPGTYIQLNVEKFAELIVREMLQTCEDHPAWTGRMIGEKIKQHFGVEE